MVPRNWNNRDFTKSNGKVSGTSEGSFHSWRMLWKESAQPEFSRRGHERFVQNRAQKADQECWLRILKLSNGRQFVNSKYRLL